MDLAIRWSSTRGSCGRIEGEARNMKSMRPPSAAIFTGRNEVVAKVIFLHLSVIHSVHRGGLPQCMLGYPTGIRHHPPLDQTPPSPGRPPRSDTPPDQTPPPPPNQTPPPQTRQTPQEADSSIQSTSSWYASYWNAFLCMTYFCSPLDPLLVLQMEDRHTNRHKNLPNVR